MLLRRYHKNKEDPFKKIEEVEEITEEEIDLNSLKVDELKGLAKEKEIEGYSKLKKEELIAALAGD